MKQPDTKQIASKPIPDYGLVLFHVWLYACALFIGMWIDSRYHVLEQIAHRGPDTTIHSARGISNECN